MITSILYPELILRNSITITNSLITSVKYLSSISKHDHNLQNLLNIIEDINVIKSFIDEQKCTSESKTVKMCIENLNLNLVKLENIINIITDKIQNHHKKWFSYIRSYDIEKEREMIPLLLNEMNHKFELLIKVSRSL